MLHRSGNLLGTSPRSENHTSGVIMMLQLSQILGHWYHGQKSTLQKKQIQHNYKSNIKVSNKYETLNMIDDK